MARRGKNKATNDTDEDIDCGESDSCLNDVESVYEPTDECIDASTACCTEIWNTYCAADCGLLLIIVHLMDVQ